MAGKVNITINIREIENGFIVSGNKNRDNTPTFAPEEFVSNRLQLGQWATAYINEAD